MLHLHEKLGMPFLQMHDNFKPKDFDHVATFAENWTYQVPLAIELRHSDWYNDTAVASRLYELLEKHGITNVLVDAAGRRDLMHMRLTTSTAFVRGSARMSPNQIAHALMNGSDESPDGKRLVYGNSSSSSTKMMSRNHLHSLHISSSNSTTRSALPFLSLRSLRIKGFFEGSKSFQTGGEAG